MNRLVSADALERLLLQQPQDLGLERQGHVSHFVEENGPVIALLELADAASFGPGEGALLVAEQLALEQGLGTGRAVEGQERCLGAGAVLVNRAGNQLLARAALAGDQNRKGLVGDAADRLEDLLHRRAAAHESLAREVIVRRHLRDDGPARASGRAAFRASPITRPSFCTSSGLSR